MGLISWDTLFFYYISNTKLLCHFQPMSIRSEDFTSDDVGLSDGFTTMGAGVGLTEGQSCNK